MKNIIIKDPELIFASHIQGICSKTLLLFAVLLLSLYSFVLCLLGGNLPESYSNLYVLPGVFLIVTVFWAYFFLKGNFYFDLPVLIILTTFFIRNVITPIVMANGNALTMFGYPSKDNADFGIFLMAYETISVFLTIFIYVLKPFKIKRSYRKIRINSVRHKGNILFYFIFAGALIVSILTFLMLPELRTQYYSIFTSGISGIAETKIVYTSGLHRIFYSAGELVIEATRLILCSFLFYKIRLRGETFKNFVFCLLIVVANLFFMTDSNAYVLILMIALFIVTFRLFPKYKKTGAQIVIFLCLVFLCLMWINRFSQDHYGTSISTFLNAYFPGVANCAGIMKLMPRNIFDSVGQLFADIYAAVPFRSTLFGYSGGLVDISTRWNNANGITGQILPMAAQSYYYFGLFLSPLLSCLITAVSLKSFDAANRTQNPLKYAVLIFITIYSAVAVCMYNGFIFANGFTNRILFMIIIAWVSEYSFPNIDNNYKDGQIDPLR